MARKPRIEVEGGLYHVITRGVERRDIFHSPEDYQKFLSMLDEQKSKLPFYLYAYCLMTNHIHLLIERRTDDIGRIMHRVLTGYTQYYNRKYGRSGHLLQGRYKAILCQTDAYLAELVRYIHLNPIRAKMVERTEDYPYSSHRAYLGLEPARLIDVDPVLRLFGPRKKAARERFAAHVAAGMRQGNLAELYRTTGGVLGSEEFVDSMIHRISEHDVHAAASRRRAAGERPGLDPTLLIATVESVTGVSQSDFCGRGKSARVGSAKQVLFLAGRRFGASVTELAKLTGMTISNVSRRSDAAAKRSATDEEFQKIVAQAYDNYLLNVVGNT
jgi:putative transposase